MSSTEILRLEEEAMNITINLSKELNKQITPITEKAAKLIEKSKIESSEKGSHFTNLEQELNLLLKTLPSHITLINLRDEYDFNLLEDFYYRIMKPNFPMEEELDSLENFDRNLRSDSFLDNEIAVLFDERTQMVAGGVIYDYYSVSNVGLLSYFCIDQRDARYRGMGLGKFLVQYAFLRCQSRARNFNKSKEARTFRKAMLKQLFNHDSKSLTNLKKIFKKKYFQQDATKNDMFAFLAETNKLGVSDGVLESDLRHKILSSIGFRFLDVVYVQPPLYENLAPCFDLILLAYKDSVHSSNHTLEIPRELILSYMTEAAYAVSETKPFDYRDESYFKIVEDKLLSGPDTYELLEMPWVLGRTQTQTNKKNLKKVDKNFSSSHTFDKN